MDLVWFQGLGTVIAGPQSRFTNRPVAGPILAVGARFHPGVAPTLLRTAAVDFIDDHVPLSRVDARLAARLDDELDGAGDPRAVLAALERALIGLSVGTEPDPVVRDAVHWLQQGCAVTETVSRVFLSERQLERRFIEHVGYGPKALQRVLRLQRVLAHLRSRPREGGLAGTAASAGYADQAHLSRESRRLTGLTPRQLASWMS